MLAPELVDHNEGWDAAFAERLALAESSHFWFRARNRLIEWAVKKYFPDATSFLDLGCGTGAVLTAMRKAFPDMSITAADGTPESVAIASERVDDVQLLQCDARCLPFVAEFGLVGAFDVIEHIEEDEAVLKRLYQAVRPGGGIIITVPQHQWLWSVADDFSFHKRRYTRQDLVRKVTQSGFTVIRTTSFVSVLLPAIILSRRRLPKRVEEFDPMTEYQMNSFTSRLLFRAMTCELELVRAGLNLPLGGSLLLVGRR